MSSQSGATTEDFLRKTTQTPFRQDSQLSPNDDQVERAQTVKELPRRKENDPTALDVINQLIDNKEEEKASHHMKGHLSQDIIHETFLMDAEQKFPESSLRINCETHNAPATFWSRQEQKYQCLKCIVAKEDLQYIDKKYKRQLEDFEAIKAFAQKAIKENDPHIHIIAEWKAQIRDTLIQVKEKYVEWIETFTHKFVKSLNKIEHSSQLSEFIGEDKRQELRLLDMHSKYNEILSVFYKIQCAKPDDKLTTIESLKPKMTQLQQYLVSKDKEMKKTTNRVNKAMRETVDLSDLDTKIFGKYFKFIEQKAQSPPSIVAGSKNKKAAAQTKTKPEQSATDRGGKATMTKKPADKLADTPKKGSSGSNTTDPQERSQAAHAQVKKNSAAKETANQSSQQPVRQVAQQAEQGSDLAQGPQSRGQPDLDTSVMTTNSRYRHENQNSIYYLKPSSQSIYLLDFSQQGFVEEQLTWKNGQGIIPSGATSSQISDSSVYVIGGYQESFSLNGGEPTVLRNCMQIDANMTVYPRQQMQTARYGATTALVRDRFVLALSGMTGSKTSTKTCEAYDTQTNHWFSISDLPVALCNTSALVMNNRFVYVLPGSNPDCLKEAGQSITIHMLDSGNSNSFVGDKNSKQYGAPISRQPWHELSVANADFVKAQPCAALQTGSSEMVIFGGMSKQVFKFDTREVNMVTKKASVVSGQAGELGRLGNFGKSDYIGRLFNDIGYIIDASDKQLHVYQTKNKTWQIQSLAALGLE